MVDGHCFLPLVLALEKDQQVEDIDEEAILVGSLDSNWATTTSDGDVSCVFVLFSSTTSPYFATDQWFKLALM
jgi:hypothetical protein